MPVSLARLLGPFLAVPIQCLPELPHFVGCLRQSLGQTLVLSTQCHFALLRLDGGLLQPLDHLGSLGRSAL